MNVFFRPSSLAALLVLYFGHARAEVTRSPVAAKEEAEMHFRKGRELLAAGDARAACDAFSESYRIEAALGTLLNLADCHEKQGLDSQALELFKDAEQMAQRLGHFGREKVARERIQLIEARLRDTPALAEPQLQTSPPALASAMEPSPPTPLATQVELSKPNARSPLGKVLTAVGGATLAAGVAGIVYSHRVHHAAQRQQPGGPAYENPTVTRAQFERLGVIYPAAWALAVAGATTTGCGVYFWMSPQGDVSAIPIHGEAGLRGSF